MPDAPSHHSPAPDAYDASGIHLQPALRQVKASAGSGKTYELTRRFLRHLARTPRQGHHPGCGLHGTQTAGWGDILAVTFTNSAAAEMKERVLRRLKECALALAVEEGISPRQAAQWVDIILRQYGALNIRTIDSLLHLVVRTAALDLGLPPDFQPSFATEETLTPILDACLERAWQGDARILRLLHDACRSLLLHGEAKGFMPGNKLVEKLPPLLDMVMLGSLPELSPPEALEEKLATAVGDFCQYAAHTLKHMDEEGLPLKKGVRDVMARAARGELRTLDSAWLAKDNLDACVLKAGQGRASAPAQRAYAQVVDVADYLRGTGHILRKGLELFPFVMLAREVAAGLEEFQQEEGKVPGVLMPALARQVLELAHGVPAALCRLGSSLNHILVDEFQDTSVEQWQALRPLAEEALSRGGSLTWVGDIKQAIYGWRGGDASLFDGVLHDGGLRAIAPQPDQQWLDTNWRSLPEIVHCNNTFFSCLAKTAIARDTLQAMLPKDTPDTVLDEAAATLAATFAQATQKTRPACGGQGNHPGGGLVSLTLVTAALADELNEAVRDALHQRLLGDLASRRPWGDITILVRSNKAAALVASWLMGWSVPVITENSLLLGEHPLVAESVAFLSFLDAPQDDLSFWTVLTGTLMAPCLAPEEEKAGLKHPVRPSLAYVHRWALARGKGRKSTLCRAFKEDFPDYWAKWFAPFHSKAGLMSPYDMVQEWYGLLRVSQRFPQAQTFVRRFLEVLHTAGERGLSTATAFLEHWKRNGGEEKVPMPTGMNAVNIMTIHKSKGLQFPVVIIPWMTFSGRGSSDAVAVEVDGLRVLAPRCKEMGDMHYAALAQNARESLNLLYVAWTRAEQELHAFHTTTPGHLRMHSLSNALETLLPAAGFSLPCQWGEAHTSTAGPAAHACPDADAPGTPAPPVWDGAPSPHWKPMHWLPRLKVFRNPLQELGMTAKRRGILTHHCLEQLQSTGHTDEDAHLAVDVGMRTFALPVEDAEGTLRAELTRALAWYISLPDTAHWTLHGLPEQTLVDESGHFHRVDLLLPPLTQSEGWLAIDYKTGEAPATSDAAGPPDPHVTQIRRYLALLDKLENGEQHLPPPRGVLIYLDLQRCRVVTRHGMSPLLHSLADARDLA